MNNQPKEKIKLLLVEDDEDFSAALSSRLAKRNFSVTVAPTGESALDKLKEASFDVIVADIKLPGMDGMEFLSRVRKSNNNLPIIMLTGYASMESAKEAVRLNAADYILKPLDTIDDLLNPIDKAVHSYKLSTENRKLMNDLQIKVEELKESKAKLEKQRLALEQKNLALNEIIEHMERTKNKTKEDIAINVEELIVPLLKKLELKGTSRRYVHLILNHLENLTSSFGRKIILRSTKLSPREVEICSIIKGGLTSKEISQVLNISHQTVEKHRKSIRKKLGISGKKVNLTSFLQSL